MIQELKWDSEFFNLKIGEWDIDNTPGAGQTDFTLVVAKSDNNGVPALAGYEKTFTETRIVFAKKPEVQEVSGDTIREATNDDSLEGLYELAYESGKYSRFRLDKRIGETAFKKLYRAWIDNSLNRRFADGILVYEGEAVIRGLVTYKIHKGYATIGLIAVSPLWQGHGIGKKLLRHVEQLLANKDIDELRIPTQMENKEACSFYMKQGYAVADTKYIIHYWKQ
jgi:dTDP-4-amino-4,6-dideoxy-D-galactose acyltransferase